MSWRVGKRVPLNVYDGERPVCQCHTEADARKIVDAVNARSGEVDNKKEDNTAGFIEFDAISDISCRLYNAMKKSRIETLGDAAKLTRAEILRIKNCGRRSLNELQQILSSHSLHLKGEHWQR